MKVLFDVEPTGTADIDTNFFNIMMKLKEEVYNIVREFEKEIEKDRGITVLSMRPYHYAAEYLNQKDIKFRVKIQRLLNKLDFDDAIAKSIRR